MRGTAGQQAWGPARIRTRFDVRGGLEPLPAGVHLDASDVHLTTSDLGKRQSRVGQECIRYTSECTRASITPSILRTLR